MTFVLFMMPAISEFATKCSGLNHVVKSCSNSKIVCPKCSLEHTVKECPSISLPKCMNCVNAGLDENNHLAWDKTKCTIYQSI